MSKETEMLERVRSALAIKRGTAQQRNLNTAKMFLENKLLASNKGLELPVIPNYGVGNVFSDAEESVEWTDITIAILESVRDDSYDWTNIDTISNIIREISYITKELAFIDDLIESIKLIRANKEKSIYSDI